MHHCTTAATQWLENYRDAAATARRPINFTTSVRLVSEQMNSTLIILYTRQSPALTPSLIITEKYVRLTVDRLIDGKQKSTKIKCTFIAVKHVHRKRSFGPASSDRSSFSVLLTILKLCSFSQG